MAGRTRRASTSSVETVDDDQVHWRKETSVLKSVPKGSDNNVWPIFQLRDAVVLNKDGTTLENALDVGSRGPFIVRGTLMIDDPDEKKHLLMRVRKSIPIEVQQSTLYSIGIDDSISQPLVWVSGRAGWYEISPTPTYQAIYSNMCEAAILYYRLMDAYKFIKPKPPKKGRQVSLMKDLAPVFHHAAALIGDGATLEDVIQRCTDHAPFLIAQALQEGDFDWVSTSFYKWLTAKHNTTLKNVEERMRNPPKHSRSPSSESVPPLIKTEVLPSRTRAGSTVSSTVSASRSKPADVASIDSSPPRSRSAKSRSIVQNDPESSPFTRQTPPKPSSPPMARDAPPSASEEDDPLAAIARAVNWAFDECAPKAKVITMARLINKIYFAYKFPNFKNGTVGCHRIPVEEVLQYHASGLLETLDKQKYSGHEVLSWLREALQKPFAPIAITSWPYHVMPRNQRPMVPRNRQETKQAKPAPTTPAVEPHTPDEDSSSTTGPVARVGKTVKRPGRPGRKGGLRLATASKKRPHADVDSDSEPDEPAAKTSHYFSDDEAMDDVDGSSSIEEAEQEPISFVIRADKMPSTTAKGPNETWVCDQEDCDYVVRGGTAEECQDRIQKHFAAHEAEVDRVNLALTESRGHLPINHLLERIKQMGEKRAQQGQLSVDGVAAPQPIKRKLIV